MGVVYAAHDERLDRAVAIKRMRQGADEQERQRLWREARVAASVSHPNICQLYEIEEDGVELFLTMELLDGEPLSARLERGPLSPPEAGQIALSVLSALAALHDHGIVHRDLKPSNIFLSRHGVKLLDFGISRALTGAGAVQGVPTLSGLIVGTPRYMAPEQLEGKTVDLRSDLFALGMVLYEMVAGRPPFDGGSIFEVATAILKDEPPALGGSSGIIALDRIIQRALRKPPDARYQTAAVFAQELRSAMLVTDSTEAPSVRPMTRLVVLPFRVLRPDPAIDFLAFSLADAISSALSGLPALVVRSTAAAAAFANGTPDFAALARALDVDVALLGTLLSSGGQVRVSAQLVQVPSGTLLRPITSQVTGGEIFQLQDNLAQSIVESLSLSLTARDQGRINRDVPASQEAYEWYLRANQLQLDSKHWPAALDLYRRCVERDPQFAPAWARLGRCYRVMGKFGDRAAVRRQPGQRRASPEARARHQPGSVAGPQSLCAVRGRGRPRPRGDGSAARPRANVAVRARALCGTRPRLPLLRAARCVRSGRRARAPSRSSRRDEHRADVRAEARLGAGDRRRHEQYADREGPRAGLQRQPRRSGGGAARPDRARTSGSRCRRCSRDCWISSKATAAGCCRRFIGWSIPRWAPILKRCTTGPARCAKPATMTVRWDCSNASLDAGYYPAWTLVNDPRFDPVRGSTDFRTLARRAEELQKRAVESFRAADGPRLLGLPQG